MKIDFANDVTNAEEQTKGSDGRLNVSSRSDSRAYYNSRDVSECYSVAFFDTRATAGDYVFYLKNDKTDGKHLVVHSFGINCQTGSGVFKLSTVTGTCTGGAAYTPFNLNQGGVAKSATVTCRTTTDSNSSPLAGLTESAVIDIASVSSAYGQEGLRIGDTLRLGQDQAIGLEFDIGTTDDDVFGVCFFYFE